MTINAHNVQQDIIQVEHHVNYAIQFMHHVPHVHKQLKRVLNVQPDIMSQEEVVLNVQIR